MKQQYTLEELELKCRLAFKAGESYSLSTHEDFITSPINENEWIKQNIYNYEQ